MLLQNIMSLMKKFITSLLLFLVIGLSSCNYQTIMYIYEDDYNLLNQNLVLPVYCNVFNSPYSNIENIVNVTLFDDDNRINLEIESINYMGEVEGKYKYELVFNMVKFKDEFIKFINPIIEIQYVNDVFLPIKLSSIVIYNKDFSSDLSLINLKGEYDDILESINFELKNNTSKNIHITDLTLITAHFGADLMNLELIYSLEEEKDEEGESEYSKVKLSLLSEEIVVLPYQSIKIRLPLCHYNHTLGNQCGVVLQYKINNETKYMGLRNFVFFANKENKLGVYDVAN